MKYEWLTDCAYAHRGLHGPLNGFVENSPSAFQSAIKGGYGFELDVLLSRDNTAMVFHDTDLARLTGNSGDISSVDANNLRHIPLKGSEDTIPALTDILAATAGKTPVLIEIKGDQGKYDTIAQAVWQDIRGYEGPLAVMSFFPDILRWFRKQDCPVPIGLVATDINDASLPDKYFSTQFQIDIIEELQADFIAYDIRALPNDVTRQCRQQDIAVLTWTVRTQQDRLKAASHTDNIIFENYAP